MTASDNPKSTEEALRPDMLQTGMYFATRFRIDKSLGQGSMGKVYLASDMMLGEEKIALKILSSDLETNESHLARFLREVQLTRQVTHSAVVRTFDIGTHGGCHFFTMEYVAGRTLSQAIRGQPSDPPKAIDILVQLCEGLDAIHAKGIIHRDLKTSNVMLTDEGKVKIADFGIARPNSSNLTSQGELVGSATHMAPEVWKQSEITHFSDLYSLGVIAYELLTGVLPFEGATAYELMWKHLKELPVSPLEIHSGIPPWLASLTLRLLSKEPSDRPRSAREILRELKIHSKQDPSSSAINKKVDIKVEPGEENVLDDSKNTKSPNLPSAIALSSVFTTDPSGMDEILKSESQQPIPTLVEIKRLRAKPLRTMLKNFILALPIMLLVGLALLALGHYAIPLPIALGNPYLPLFNSLLTAFVVSALLLMPFMLLIACFDGVTKGLFSVIKLSFIALSIYLLLFGINLFVISQVSNSSTNAAHLKEAVSSAEASVLALSEVVIFKTTPSAQNPVPARSHTFQQFQAGGPLLLRQRVPHLFSIFFLLSLVIAISCQARDRHHNNFKFIFLTIPILVAVTTHFIINTLGVSGVPTVLLPIGSKPIPLMLTDILVGLVVWFSVLLCARRSRAELA